MDNIFNQLTEKLGVDPSELKEKADGLLNQHRDQIPDDIENKIDAALHGDIGSALQGIPGIGGLFGGAKPAEEAEAAHVEEESAESEVEESEEEGGDFDTEESEDESEEEEVDEESNEEESEEEVEEAEEEESEVEEPTEEEA